MPEIAVAFTVSGQREKYLRQALDSWAGVRGVRDAVMVFCVEPHRAFPLEEFSRWAGQVFPQAMVCPNPAVLGCHANTWRAFQWAFDAGARLGVMAEEDLVVSAGVLEYLAWAMEEYEDDEQVTAVCAHARDSAGDGYDDAVVRASWFSPLVCGTWKDRWEGFISPRWRYRRPGDPVDLSDAGQAWDTNLRSEIVRAGRQCVFPVRSRVQHIGEFSTWMTPVVAEFTYPDSRSGCFAPDHQVGRFREVPFRSVPGLRV